jgi:GH43 family beta-xylosidase
MNFRSTLIIINLPAGEPTGIEVTSLGKRIYNDELNLVSETEEGHRSYRIYGWEPGYHEIEGTDLYDPGHRAARLLHLGTVPRR